WRDARESADDQPQVVRRSGVGQGAREVVVDAPPLIQRDSEHVADVSFEVAALQRVLGKGVGAGGNDPAGCDELFGEAGHVWCSPVQVITVWTGSVPKESL